MYKKSVSFLYMYCLDRFKDNNVPCADEEDASNCQNIDDRRPDTLWYSGILDSHYNFT